MPSRMDYKYKRVIAANPAPPHLFTQCDSSSSPDPSTATSPTHHKLSSLSLHQPILPQQPASFIAAVHTDTSSSSSAPPTTTHTHSRFPALGPPRPFSSAQSVRPRIVRTEDEDDEDGGDEEGTGSAGERDGFSDTSSAFSAFSRSREELDRRREEREARAREEEKRRLDGKARLEKVAAVAQKATQARLRAASAEKAQRREEENELRAVVAQVQAREERERQEARARRATQAELQRGEQDQAERRQGEERREDVEKRQMERAKEASMRREHSNGASQPSRVKHDSQAASPPPPTSSASSPSSAASLLPPTSAASRRPVRADLLASSLPPNPSYYPTHIHSLLSTAFLPPLSRLFKHYHQRAPSSSASPAYVDMAGGVRASVLSSGDWLLMMSECGVSGVLLSKDGLRRLYMLAVRTERKRSGGSSGEVEMKEKSEERQNGLGLGRFLKSLWCVARSVGGSERADDGEGGRQEADVRVMLALLEYIRHHATPQRLGAQLRLQWPDISLKEAVDVHSRAAPTPTHTAATHSNKPVKRKEDQKASNTDTPATTTAAAATAITLPPTQQPSASQPPSIPASAGTAAEDASERERRERKRLRLKLRVEQYRREQEEKERSRAEEERRRRAEEEEREAERRRREERLRDDEKRRIAEFKARRKEEIEEMARAEAEKAERDERERRRALELYMRQKAERKRREEAEQRQRLMHFHQQLSAHEAAADKESVEDSQQPHDKPMAQQEERKRRQWDKRPTSIAETTFPTFNHSPAASPPTATRNTSLSSTALSTLQPAADAVGGSEDDGLSLGGGSTELDGEDPNEETF